MFCCLPVTLFRFYFFLKICSQVTYSLHVFSNSAEKWQLSRFKLSDNFRLSMYNRHNLTWKYPFFRGLYNLHKNTLSFLLHMYIFWRTSIRQTAVCYIDVPYSTDFDILRYSSVTIARSRQKYLVFVVLRQISTSKKLLSVRLRSILFCKQNSLVF